MSAYNDIQVWIMKQLNMPKQKLSYENLIFVTGNCGIGKTYNILRICKELDLDVVYITSTNCSSSAELQDMIVKNLTSSMLQVLMNEVRNKIVVIDEFECIVALDRTINNTLCTILSENKLKMMPIICISLPDVIKHIGTIKKKCQIINIDNPSNDELYQILVNKYPDKSNDYLQCICETSNGNISHCIQMIENRITFACDSVKNIEDVMYTTKDRVHLKQHISLDPWIIPLKIHENFISELKMKKCNVKSMNDIYKQFMKDFIIFDMLMSKNNIEYACDLFVSILLILNNIPDNYKKVNRKYNFTKLLSYMSLQKKYMKKSYSANFPLYQIGNYHINIVGRNYIFFN